MADALNVQDGTRTIFGGSNTAGPVVVVADPNSAVLGATDPAAANQSIFGSPAANLAASSAGYRYQITAGGTTAANAVKISDTVSVTPQLNVNPNATVPPAGPLGTNAFTQMLDAFAAVADFGNATLNPNPTPTDIANARQQIFNALNGVAGTYSGLEAMQTQVETVRSTIKVVQDSQTNLQTYATNTIANIQNVDTNETSVKLLQDQNQLQMSMSVLAKITSISLLDYLK